jgi:DNA topoisomerase III
MGKPLIIAEKPSVASDIAKALGGFTKDKSGEFFESDKYVISSAVGHLLQITVPEEFEVKRGKWTFKALPVIPPRFDLMPIEKSESRLKVLLKLIKRKDVDALVNACDAGREGELIFRYIVQYANTDKPIKRLWLQSMTAASIREGFEQLRQDEDMRPLADAAVCRSESDWLVGINATRALTAFNSKAGGFYLTTAGRVQTPTLAILVEREEKIKNFVSRDYWEVCGTFGAQAGEYVGKWFDEKFEKKEGDEHLRPDRVWEISRAEAIRDKCLGKPGIVTEESKPTTQLSPLLYDLTSLQREANGRFGFSAKNTLGLAQALYERHKVLTYPRTDARALPEDYIGTVKKTLEVLGETHYSEFANKILKSDWVQPNKRIFNNAKISDHFAIIPTQVAPKGLSEPEQKLYDMVTRRFLAVFYPAAEFLVTTRITRVEGEPFKSEGKVMVNAGWLAIYGKEAQAEGDDSGTNLVAVQPNETVKTTNIEVQANQTKPPPRFTEATLLSAMESAGKLVDDEELRAAMKDKGLGTPATRAAIIEGLLYEKYVVRNQRELQPTAKAFSLMALLRGLDIPQLTSPELTGEWEFKLRQMTRRKFERSRFMDEIKAMTEDIVAKAKSFESDTVPGDFGTLKVPCPKCGGEVHERYKSFKCEKCDWEMRKILGSRQIEIHEAEELLEKKTIGPLQGFRSKMGKPFAAVLKFTPELKVEFDFGNEQKDGEAAVEVDFTGKEPLGKCPKCGANVFENGMNYICEKSTGPNKTCDFRTGAVILQQQIDKEQIKKLLSTGKTDLLTKFISKKNNRPFKAFLAVDKNGKVGFEFAPREGKPKGEGKAKDPAQIIDFTDKEPLGKCPKCGGKIFETEADYICERSQADTKKCKFKVSKNILQQPIEHEQLKKLLATGKTDLLDKFISKAGKPFPAFLVMDENGKVTFEFPERDAEATTS